MDDRENVIRQNYEKIRNRIDSAALLAGRSPDEVHLVVVTKSQPPEVVRAAVEAGARIFGENYPEETQEKMNALGPIEGVSWHMIGHLQSRKAALVTRHFDLLESLDSVRLAERLERLLSEQDRILPVLLEMNVSGEESKFGWPAWDENHFELLLPDIEKVFAMPHISVRGLMTMPPLYDDPNQTRPFFARLRSIRESLSQRFSRSAFSELSMGTSADFEAAVLEGATYVRIGTAIVGPRPRKNTR